jgi:hypothetical protein
MFTWLQEEERDYSLLPIDHTTCGGTEDEWSNVEWNVTIPQQIKSMDYPISSVFCHCFQQELDQLQLEWLDENGNVLEKKDTVELNRILKKMNLLSVSIQYLNTIIPCGR